MNRIEMNRPANTKNSYLIVFKQNFPYEFHSCEIIKINMEKSEQKWKIETNPNQFRCGNIPQVKWMNI